MLRKLLEALALVLIAVGGALSLALFYTLIVGFFSGTRQETMLAVLMLFVCSLFLVLYGKILDIFLD
jgi:hypothetical protein